MVNYKTENEKLICVFSGSLNTTASDKVEKELFSKIGEAGLPVVFDLKEVSYIASSFLRICQKAYKAAGEERFSIINVSPDIKKVFKITGFDKFMDIQ